MKKLRMKPSSLVLATPSTKARPDRQAHLRPLDQAALAMITGGCEESTTNDGWDPSANDDWEAPIA